MSSPGANRPEEGIGDVGVPEVPMSEKDLSPIVAVKDMKDEAGVTVHDTTAEIDHEISDTIIITGGDVAAHLIPLRDDFDSAITFRSVFLSSALVCFTASLNQIYYFKPSGNPLTNGFILLIAYFLGVGWAKYFPTADRFEDRWKARGGQGKRPRWISIINFLNPGPFTLKEHAVILICSTSASDDSGATSLFSAQRLFYDLPLSATTVVLGTISIGLFGYGIAGALRPIAVWHPEAVYWGNLPLVKTIQELHWQNVDSRRLKSFWYSLGGMAIYQVIPGYLFTWLNGVSIPCLASQKATGEKGSILTNLFGGSVANEGLGLFCLCFDWQFIGSGSIAAPLKLQLHQLIGIGLCSLIMIGIYYGNVWDSRSLPFMSSSLRMDNGTVYPVKKIFPGGLLDKSLLEKYGIPRLTGSFAYGLLMANAAIGALIMHCFIFWGKDIVKSYRRAFNGDHNDPHHLHMSKHYQETPWWWYAISLVVSFFLGLIVVLKEDITLPAWAYVVSLVFGIIVAHFSVILFSRFGNGIATNNLSKMLAGLMIPGRPIGNMYFALWSHNVIATSVDLCSNLKMGEYMKIPSRVVFAMQIWGAMLGAFINYALMNYIIKGHRDILTNGNGNTFWTGANAQSYSTNAASWALAPYMYKLGSRYEMVPIAIAFGAAAVVVHRLAYQVLPKIGRFNMSEINLPQLIQYSGFLQLNSPRTGPLLMGFIIGILGQYYIRNYHPRFYKNHFWILACGLDAGTGITMFILTFAVFGVGGPEHSFPQWWGNNQAGYTDWCPFPSSN